MEMRMIKVMGLFLILNLCAIECIPNDDQFALASSLIVGRDGYD